MSFSVKDWKDRPVSLNPNPGETVADWLGRITEYATAHPGELTPVNAGALEDLETRLSGYTDAQIAAIAATIAGFAPLASPALTGTPTAPTQTSSDDSTRLATTAFVHDLADLLAPLASPALTGNPTAPTQTAGNNSTRIATTAFVAAAIAALGGGGGGGGGVTPLSWTSLSFTSGWTDEGGFAYPCKWAKDDYGIVHLRGTAIKTSGGFTLFDQIFQLPVGARPTAEYELVTYLSDTATARFPITLFFTTAGGVYINSVLGGGTPDHSDHGYIRLDSLTFPTS